MVAIRFNEEHNLLVEPPTAHTSTILIGFTTAAIKPWKVQTKIYQSWIFTRTKKCLGSIYPVPPITLYYTMLNREQLITQDCCL